MFERKISSFAYLVIAGTVLAGCSNDDGTPKALRHGDALTMCQIALQKASRDPDKAEFPYVENQGIGSEFRYVWSTETKVARMRNGLGMDVATSAACAVDGPTKSITSLSVGGQKLL